MMNIVLVPALLGLMFVDAAQSAPQADSQPTAQANNSRPQPSPLEKIRRLTAAELQESLKRGDVVVVDVRSEADWQAGHIKGAKLLTGKEITTRAGELDRNKLIVTYCNCPREMSAAFAASELERIGFKRVAALRGGYKGAERAGLPIEKKEEKQ